MGSSGDRAASLKTAKTRSAHARARRFEYLARMCPTLRRAFNRIDSDQQAGFQKATHRKAEGSTVSPQNCINSPTNAYYAEVVLISKKLFIFKAFCSHRPLIKSFNLCTLGSLRVRRLAWLRGRLA